MFSLEPELEQLRADGALTDVTAARLIVLERREIVSVYAELRLLTWAGVMLIATGVGVIVSKNLDRLGPLAIASAIGIASIACYAYAAWKRRRGESLIDDYVLLLAALLASADVGFIESQYHLLGSEWPRHFLLLALLHGITAYLFGSRVVLSLSITALAAWLGIERRVDTFFDSTPETAVRAFVCAAIVMTWRVVDGAVRRSGVGGRESEKPVEHPTPDSQPPTPQPFAPVFDHAATNLAFWGALILTFAQETRVSGGLIAVAFAVASMVYARRRGEPAFAIYAWVYGTIAVDVLVCHWLGDDVLIMLYLVVSTIAAIIGLFVTHGRLRQPAGEGVR